MTKTNFFEILHSAITGKPPAKDSTSAPTEPTPEKSDTAWAKNIGDQMGLPPVNTSVSTAAERNQAAIDQSSTVAKYPEEKWKPKL